MAPFFKVTLESTERNARETKEVAVKPALVDAEYSKPFHHFIAF
jgi:hypothetical protein